MAQQKLQNQSYNVDEFVNRALKNTYGNGGTGTAQQAQQNRQHKQYSDAEKRMFYMGLGSTMSRTEEGRKKHVVAMTGGDKSLIRSYENGRKKGTERKQKYLQTQRTARQAAKGKGAK